MSMATVLRLKMGSFISDITANISELRGESAKASKALEAAIENIANITRKSLDRLHRQHNLVVTGVPYLSEEKLGTYFHDWCRALGYSHEGYTPVVSAQRISKRRISVNRSSAIILRFAIRSQRDDFFSRYLRTCNLSLRSIGFSSSERIFVNEDLGPEERKLRATAIGLKKRGIFRSVFSRNGIVLVRLVSTRRTLAVTSKASLEQFLNAEQLKPFP